MPKSDTAQLLKIFEEFSPQVMSNGQIRMGCPFKDNHTDGSGKMSFFVSPDINAYHCFSCGEHGNLIRLLTNTFGVNYFEAAGMVRLTDYTPEKKEFDLDIIWNQTPPKEFLERGYSEKTLNHFKVGTTDDGSIIIPYYSNFENGGTLIGYQERKYINGNRVVKNNKGFDKKNYLYNLNTDKDYTILVEGQSDVWRLYEYGYNACAIMGSNLSDEQLKMLLGFEKIYLALDNDEAGRRATETCQYLLQNSVPCLELVPYTTKDPGECSKKEWDNAFENSTNYLVYSMEMSMGWDGYLDMREDVLRGLKHRV